MRKKQLYAIILAGALAAGSVPGTAFAAETGAPQPTAETSAADTEEGTGTEVPGTQEGSGEEGEPTEPETPQEQGETEEQGGQSGTDVPEENGNTAPPADQNSSTNTPQPPSAPQDPSAPTGPADTPAAPQEETPAANEPSAGDPLDQRAGQLADTETDNPEGYSEDPTGVYISFVDESGAETKKEYYVTLQDAMNAAIGYYQEETHDKNKAVVVKIEEQVSISETVKIENGKINLVATKDVSIGRGIDAKDPSKMLLGNMFEITGSESELQLSAEGEGKLSISGKNPGDGSQPVTGSLISVSDNGRFGMSDKVILFENSTTADGAAIQASGTENIVLKGGVITGNTGAKGAVYTDKNICMQGTVQIKDNLNTSKAKANLYLDQDAKVVVTDVMKDSEIHVTSAKAADKAVIAEAGTKVNKDNPNGVKLTEEEFKTVPEQLKYDDEKLYTIALGEDKLTAVLEAVKEPGPTPNQPAVTESKITGLEKPLKFFPNKAYSFKVVGAGQDNKKPNNGDIRWKPLYWAQKEQPTDNEKRENWSIKLTEGLQEARSFVMYVFFCQQVYDAEKKEWIDTKTIEYKKIEFKSAAISDEEWNDYNADYLTYQNGTFEWEDHSTAYVEIATTKNVNWGYGYIDAGSSNKEILKAAKDIKLTEKQKANKRLQVTAESVPEKESLLIVSAMSNDNNKDFAFVVIKLNNKNRPDDSPGERKPYKYKVSESTVTGLEEPLKFFPMMEYEFCVIGAGEDNKKPIAGDERWVPKYWSMYETITNDDMKKGWVDHPQKYYNPRHWPINMIKGTQKEDTYTMYIFFNKEVYNGKKWVTKAVEESMTYTFSSAYISDDEWDDYIRQYNVDHPDRPLNPDGSLVDIIPTEVPSEQDPGSSTKSAADTADTSPIGSMSALAALSLLAGGYVIVRKRKKEEI